MPRISEKVQSSNEEARYISLQRIDLVYRTLSAGKQLDPVRMCDSIRSEIDQTNQKRYFQSKNGIHKSKEQTWESIIANDKKKLKDYNFTSKAQIDAAYGPIETQLNAQSYAAASSSARAY